MWKPVPALEDKELGWQGWGASRTKTGFRGWMLNTAECIINNEVDAGVAET